MQTSAKGCNNKQMGKSRSLIYILCPNGDPDQSQNLMGSKLQPDPFSLFFSVMKIQLKVFA